MNDTRDKLSAGGPVDFEIADGEQRYAEANPRFEPRTLAAHPREFGRAHRMVWRTITDDRASEVRIRSAQLQHQQARVIRSRIRSQFGTISKYAVEVGAPAERVARMLRGEILMRFEDLVEAEIHLGPGIMRVALDEYERRRDARTS